MTVSWNEIRQTCIHGITEELDYHDCPQCKEMAIKEGLTWIDKKQTYIYTEAYLRSRWTKKR
jgi:hypothetical protein